MMYFKPKNSAVSRDQIFEELEEAAINFGDDFKADSSSDLPVDLCQRYVDQVYDLHEEFSHLDEADFNEEIGEALVEVQQKFIDELNAR